MIEEKLALGSVLVRVITSVDASERMDFLKANYLNITDIPAEGKFGKVIVLFFAIRRERFPMIMDVIKDFNLKSFYTVESVNNVSDYLIAERS